MIHTIIFKELDTQVVRIHALQHLQTGMHHGSRILFLPCQSRQQLRRVSEGSRRWPDNHWLLQSAVGWILLSLPFVCVTGKACTDGKMEGERVRQVGVSQCVLSCLLCYCLPWLSVRFFSASSASSTKDRTRGDEERIGWDRRMYSMQHPSPPEKKGRPIVAIFAVIGAMTTHLHSFLAAVLAWQASGVDICATLNQIPDHCDISVAAASRMDGKHAVDDRVDCLSIIECKLDKA